MYRQIRDWTGEIKTDMIQRISDTAFIPCDPLNKDYREYLLWEAIEGNDILAPEA